MYLVKIAKSLTHRVKILITGMTALLIGTLMILMRRSFRLTDGITHPVTEMLNKVKKVGRGNFDLLPVGAEIEEIEELDEGINKMARKINALLENVRQEKEMQHLTEPAFSVQYTGHDCLADRGRDDRGCSGYDLQSVCFFSDVAF